MEMASAARNGGGNSDSEGTRPARATLSGQSESEVTDDEPEGVDELSSLFPTALQWLHVT